MASKLKKRRRELGITQQELADRLGVTFQQIQKYERSQNRVSAGRIFEIAEALGVSVTYFFPTPANPSQQQASDLGEFVASYSALSERWKEVLRALAAVLSKA